jgi:hypothetical protein
MQMTKVSQSKDLGKQGKDVVTGFTGTVTGYCMYLTGCHQILLTPKCKEDGTAADSRWIDIDRVELQSDEKVKLVPEKKGSVRAASTDGPDMPAPIR